MLFLMCSSIIQLPNEKKNLLSSSFQSEVIPVFVSSLAEKGSYSVPDYSAESAHLATGPGGVSTFGFVYQPDLVSLESATFKS